MAYSFRRRWVLASATVVLAACSEPLGPSDVSGTYVLTSAESASLPLVVTLYDGSVHTLEADTLVLRANGTGRRNEVSRFLPISGVERRSGGEFEFTYRMDGRTMRAVVLQTGPDAKSLTFELVMSGGALVGKAFRYERMGAPAP